MPLLAIKLAFLRPQPHRCRWRLLSVLFLYFGLVQASHAYHPNRFHTNNLEPAVSKLDQQVRSYLHKKQIPGCAIAVVYQNNIIFMKAYGQRELGKEGMIDADTVFQLGSVSKPVAATLLSILEHKGYLKLDDPVQDHLNHFSINNRQRTNTLRIKHILSHSTGVPRAGFNQLIESHTPYSKILRTLQSIPARTAAGRRYDYNNAMYATLGDITKAATHLSFREALRLHLLEPLKMKSSTTTLDGLLSTHNRASPHIRGPRGQLVPRTNYSDSYYAVAPAGGINSSVRDMSVFLKAQMGGYPDILNHKMLLRIQAPQIATHAVLGSATRYPQLLKQGQYAMGWRVVNFAHHTLVFHGGWVGGFTNFVGFMPEHKLGIVVLHNSESKFSSKVAVQFFESFLNLPATPSTTKAVRKVQSTKKVRKTISTKKQRKLARVEKRKG